MGWPTTLVLVRHAESEGNVRTVEERAAFECCTAEYALTNTGEAQAKLTGEYLRERFGTFDRYYTSYYRRSKDTMRIMYPEVRIYEDARLAEGQRGIYHTMTTSQIEEHYPIELARKKREGYYHYRPFGGENWADIELRIHSFLGTLSRDYDDERVVMVVHGHWLMLFNRLVQRLSIDWAVRQYTEGGVTPNASVTIYEGKKIGNKSRLLLSEEGIVPWRGKLSTTMIDY